MLQLDAVLDAIGDYHSESFAAPVKRKPRRTRKRRMTAAGIEAVKQLRENSKRAT